VMIYGLITLVPSSECPAPPVRGGAPTRPSRVQGFLVYDESGLASPALRARGSMGFSSLAR